MKFVSKSKQIRMKKVAALLVCAAFLLPACTALLSPTASALCETVSQASFAIHHYAYSSVEGATTVPVITSSTQTLLGTQEFSTIGENNARHADYGELTLVGVIVTLNGEPVSVKIHNNGAAPAYDHIHDDGRFFYTGLSEDINSKEATFTTCACGFHVEVAQADIFYAISMANLCQSGEPQYTVAFYYMTEHENELPGHAEPSIPPPETIEPPIAPPPYIPPYPPPAPEPTPEVEQETAPTVPTTSIAPELAAYFGGIVIPEELADIIKSVSVTPPAAETHNELAEFAKSGGAELSELENKPLFTLTDIVFEMEIEGEDAPVTELDVPILVTLNLPEGADAERVVLFSKHNGELYIISDFEISEDGRSITVALQNFSPFAVGVQQASLVTADAGYFGEVNPSGSVPLAIGETRTFVFTPQIGYMVGEVCLDGIPVELSADGSLEIVGDGSSRMITVAFARLPKLERLPEIGEELELPQIIDVPIGATPVSIAPTADKPAEEGHNPKPEPALEVEPPVHIYEVETPSGSILTQSISVGQTHIIPQPLTGSGAVASERSILNLLLTMLCLFFPLFSYFTSPAQRNGAQPAISAQLLTAYLNVSAVLVYALFALIEVHSGQYHLVNKNTALFVLLSLLSASALLIQRARRTHRTSATPQ